MAQIDNSAANAFRECPYKFKEQYLSEGTGLEKQPYGNDYSALDFGGRVHELMEERYKQMQGNPIVPYPEDERPALELEAQAMLAAYAAKYPVEEWDEIVDVERTFRFKLPEFCPECASMEIDLADTRCLQCGHIFKLREHIYTGKLDVVFRLNGDLYIMDHKTQNRTSKSNQPQKWAARDQATLYLWVAEKIYGEKINRFLVNVLVRQSPKGQEPPIFPERIRLERTEDQTNWALRDICMIADDIDRHKKLFGDGVWPSHKENCYTWGECDFYLPHTYGWSDAIRKEKYMPKRPYLDLAGVPILQ